jgi:predicted dithiol-disulfide oxidoreductase (DUF899 family)
MTTPTPAADLARSAARPYPNDTPERHAAATALLAEEIELRRHLERVAAQRRALPLGGEPPPYAIVDENGKAVALADLFGRHDTLVTYFWMYGPERTKACPMCTNFLDAFDLPVKHLAQRVTFAVLGRSPVARQLAFARLRGWSNLVFYQVCDDFARDYRGLVPDGKGGTMEVPALDVWVRREGRVHHFWGSQLGGTQDPGEDPRGAPDPTPLWNVLDLTPGGRGLDWYPALDDAADAWKASAATR